MLLMVMNQASPTIRLMYNDEANNSIKYRCRFGVLISRRLIRLCLLHNIDFNENRI